MAKNPPAVWETWVRCLGWEDPLEEGLAYSSILAWRILMDRGAWWAAVHGVAKSLIRRATKHSTAQSKLLTMHSQGRVGSETFLRERLFVRCFFVRTYMETRAEWWLIAKRLSNPSLGSIEVNVRQAGLGFCPGSWFPRILRKTLLQQSYGIADPLWSVNSRLLLQGKEFWEICQSWNASKRSVPSKIFCSSCILEIMGFSKAAHNRIHWTRVALLPRA